MAKCKYIFITDTCTKGKRLDQRHVRGQTLSRTDHQWHVTKCLNDGSECPHKQTLDVNRGRR